MSYEPTGVPDELASMAYQSANVADEPAQDSNEFTSVPDESASMAH